ncbi:MAG: DNA primase, partial [Chloroflexi bacterium]
MVQELTDIQLERSGSTYKACCPFHNEKTASFFVTPSKNIYKCFGCQEGGDAADLLMKLKGLTFYEALEEIAKVGRIAVKYAEGKDYEKIKEAARKKKELAESQRIVLEKALELYQKKQRKTKTFAGRTYDKETLEAFKVIWPVPGNPLAENLKKISLKEDTARSIGLVCSVPNVSEGGSADTFSGRFLFPIFDPSGKPVALAGRAKGDEKPKYLNTKSTELFDKSQTLYGFNIARKEINATDTVYIVEGYTDVMTCWQYGLKNVVATCGTSLTEGHLNLLHRYGVKTVVLFRDGDKAGINAMKNDVSLVVAKGFTCKVLLCHEGKDPDEMARELGEKGLRGFRQAEQDGIIWRTMLEYDKNDPAKQTAAMMVAAELLSFIKNEGQRDIYKKMICRSEYLGNISKLLDREIQRFDQKAKPKKKKDIDTEENVQGMQYGIFVKDNAYYRWSSDGQHTAITNFIIIPAYLVKDRESSCRIITIKNIYGHATTISVPTDVFGTMQR